MSHHALNFLRRGQVMEIAVARAGFTDTESNGLIIYIGRIPTDTKAVTIEGSSISGHADSG